MTPLVPAICKNSSCGITFFVENPMFQGAHTVHFTGCSTGPCPKCRGDGSIIDGSYNGTLQSLMSNLKWHQIRQSIQEFHERLKTSEPEELMQGEFRHLLPLLRYAPRNPADLCAYLMVIVTAIGILLNTFGTKQAPAIQLDAQTLFALRAVSDALEHTQATKPTIPPAQIPSVGLVGPPAPPPTKNKD